MSQVITQGYGPGGQSVILQGLGGAVAATGSWCYRVRRCAFLFFDEPDWLPPVPGVGLFYLRTAGADGGWITEGGDGGWRAAGADGGWVTE